MISTVHTYKLNGIAVNIDPLNVPSLSQKTQALIKEHYHVSPPSLNDSEPLRKKLTVLHDAHHQLIGAKVYRSQDIFFASLKTAALASVLVTAILFLPGGWMAGGVFLFFALDIGVSLAETSGQPDALPPVPGFGLLIPLYMALTRISNLDKAVRKELITLQTMLKEYHAGNQKFALPVVYNFYALLAPSVMKKLEEKMEVDRRHLTVLKSFPSYDRSLNREEELSDQITTLQTAQKEVFQAFLFFQKFNPNGFNAKVNALTTH